MKKLRLPKQLKWFFWLIFIAGCLWLAFAPHRQVNLPLISVTVKVVPPKEELLPPRPGGEEQSLHDESVVVPVAPEKTETPAPEAGGKPKIAIVIDDVGVDYKDSERAITLPPPVTLSFLPYAIRLREQTKDARDAGHELILHMPMEPIGHENPGPGALLTNLPMDELRQRFAAALSSFTGFDGVNNHMGSKFTAYQAGMDMVVDELQQRHLFYLDSRTSAQSIGLKTAREKGLPSVGRDVFLDDDQSPDIIRAQLEATEKVAKRKGFAIAIGHPHPATLDVLEKWIPDVESRGFELVPLNTLVPNNGDSK